MVKGVVKLLGIGEELVNETLELLLDAIDLKESKFIVLESLDSLLKRVSDIDSNSSRYNLMGKVGDCI